MKKIIILIITIVLILVVLIGYNIYNYNNAVAKIQKANKTYESFYNVQILGTDLASLINKIEDENSKNGIEKDQDGNYIDNNKNSIMLEIKFTDLDKAITLEKIEQQGIDQFIKNFGAMSFKCTNIQYHDKTHSIKYMYFEQV